MRIVHVITGLQRGGAETLLMDVAQDLKRAGHEVSVVYFKSGPHEKTLSDRGIKAHKVQGLFLTYDPFLFFRLYIRIKKIDPDCIHGWLWMANLLSRIIGHMLSIPQISSLHNNVEQDGLLRNYIDKYTYWYAQKLVAVSQGIAHALAHKYPFICHQRVRVIPNGIDSNKINKTIVSQKKTRANVGFSEKDFVIGSVGRFVPLKNYTLLIDAFALLRRQKSGVKLVLVGHGPEERMLKERVRKLGLHHDIYFVVDQESYPYYPLFDCFVLTSYKEGISMALLEAMSCGLACIVRNDGLFHEVISHAHNGLLIDSYDPQRISALLACVIDDNDLRLRLAAQAAKDIRTLFDKKNMMHQYEALYQEMLMQHRQQRV